MINLTLPAPLAALLRDGYAQTMPRRCVISLDAPDWQEVVDALRDQHPLLAERVVTPSGLPADGIAVVVNGAILPRGKAIELAPGDEISFIPQIAGG
jgi:molybdopterin converting factor small subunit